MTDYSFRIDLGAMATAASGIRDSLQALSDNDVCDYIPNSASVAHGALADACAEFTDRWEEGARNLAKDVREMGGRLLQVAGLYSNFDVDAQGKLGAVAETVRGTNVAGTR